jgi:hypothetical protein
VLVVDWVADFTLVVVSVGDRLLQLLHEHLIAEARDGLQLLGAVAAVDLVEASEPHSKLHQTHGLSLADRNSMSH